MKLLTALFQVAVFFLVITAFPADSSARDKAGGEGIFRENPVLKAAPEPDCVTGLDLRPLFWYMQCEKRGYSSLSILLGLFDYTTIGNSFRSHLFPFAYFGSDENSSHSVVLPVWWRFKGPDYDAAYIWPFYGRSEGPGWSWTSVLFPLYVNNYDNSWGDSHHVAWPILNYYSGPGRTGFRVFPLIWYKKEKASAPVSHWAARCTVGDRNTPGLLEEGEEPFVSPYSAGQHCYAKKRTHGLVIFPFYWDVDSGTERTWHLWPFYGVSRGGNDYVQHSILWPLFRWSSGDVWENEYRNNRLKRVHCRRSDVSFMLMFSSGLLMRKGDVIEKEISFHLPLLGSLKDWAVFRRFEKKVEWADSRLEETRVLAFLYYRRTFRQGKKTDFSLELNPIFQYNSVNTLDFEKNGEEKTTSVGWNVLYGLIGRHRNEKETYWRVLWLFKL